MPESVVVREARARASERRAARCSPRAMFTRHYAHTSDTIIDNHTLMSAPRGARKPRAIALPPTPLLVSNAATLIFYAERSA